MKCKQSLVVVWPSTLSIVLGLGACAPEDEVRDAAPASQALTQTIFADGFEDGLGQFAVSGACTTSTSAESAGSRGARCDDVASLTASFSSTGFTDLVVSYSRRTNNYDSNEFFFAELSTDGGANWQALETLSNNETFAQVSFPLSAAANDNPALRLRFRSNANGFLERFDLDEVLVEGETPDVPPDDDCDGVDDDADGQVDEDGDCGGERQVLYEEDFESGTPVINLQGDCAVSASAARTGAAGLRCNDISSALLIVDATGFENLSVAYSRRTNNYDAGELFLAEYSTDGEMFTALEQSGNDTTYRDRLLALPPQTDDQAFVVLRFRSTANGFLERFDLDDLRVEGDPLGDVQRESVVRFDLESDPPGLIFDAAACAVTPDAARSGSFGLRCSGASDALFFLIDGSAYSDLLLRYSRRTSGYDAGEQLVAEYSLDGVSFSPLDQTGDDPIYRDQVVPLPPSADNPAPLVVRFRSTATGADEFFDLDDVVLEAVSANAGDQNCDGIDNDQDGAVDEGFVPEEITCGTGACLGTGSTMCDDGVLTEDCAEGEPAPSDGECNGVDDDCDFDVDEDGFDCGDIVCDGLDSDLDGATDEGFPSQPTSCGLGVCAASGQTACAGGAIVDDCEPGPPAASTDYVCNDSDGDCDGLTDEDGSCGDPITVRMDGNASDFFGMPWPSFHRVAADGSVLLDGYPGTGSSLGGAGQAAIDSAAPRLFGFGTTSAVYFTTTGAIDPGSLPDALESTADNSPVMLVNLGTFERVPVLLDFKESGAVARPDQLLSVLPHPGFALDPAASYAVILFDGLSGKGRVVEPAPLLSQLDSGDNAGTGLSQSEFDALRLAKGTVDAYVNANTDYTAADVVAFTVYNTLPVGEEIAGIAAAIGDMSDADILARIDGFAPLVTCPASCTPGEVCRAARFDVTVQLPRWQTALQVDADPVCVQLGGDDCFSSTGGDIVVGPDGRAVVQEWEVGAALRVHVPCTGEPPAAGWPIMFKGEGTGGSASSAASGTERQLNVGGRSLEHVLGAITPLHGPSRVSPALAAEVQPIVDLMQDLQPDVEFDTTRALLGLPINPIFVATNNIQNGADALFVKRILDVLESAAASHGVDPAASGLPDGAFRTDRSRSVYVGQSQGSVAAPVTLSVPPDARGGYRDAYLNAAGGGLQYERVAHRRDFRPLAEAIFFLDPNELDRFHPIGQLLQFATEAGVGINYAGALQTENLLITAGNLDGCTVRESTQALATALARAGRIEAGETSLAFELAGQTRPLLEGIETVLQQSPLPLPASGNLDDGATGIFLFLEGNHGGSRSGLAVSRFLGELGQGLTPVVEAPPYNDGSDFFVCEIRVD